LIAFCNPIGEVKLSFSPDAGMFGLEVKAVIPESWAEVAF
jgi:hypothetical protein